MTYAESLRGVQILRELWNAHVSQALWRNIGGLDRFQQAQVLFAVVREYQKDSDKARLFVESQEALEVVVRGVRGKASVTRASRGSKQGEQLPREHSDALQVVPQLPPCDGEADWRSHSWEDGIPRVASGVPSRMDRLRSIGNAVVPAIPEIIGRAIMSIGHEPA